jgi:hypothetical protein
MGGGAMPLPQGFGNNRPSGSGRFNEAPDAYRAPSVGYGTSAGRREHVRAASGGVKSAWDVKKDLPKAPPHALTSGTVVKAWFVQQSNAQYTSQVSQGHLLKRPVLHACVLSTAKPLSFTLDHCPSTSGKVRPKSATVAHTTRPLAGLNTSEYKLQGMGMENKGGMLSATAKAGGAGYSSSTFGPGGEFSLFARE